MEHPPKLTRGSFGSPPSCQNSRGSFGKNNSITTLQKGYSTRFLGGSFGGH